MRGDYRVAHAVHGGQQPHVQRSLRQKEALRHKVRIVIVTVPPPAAAAAAAAPRLPPPSLLRARLRASSVPIGGEERVARPGVPGEGAPRQGALPRQVHPRGPREVGGVQAGEVLRLAPEERAAEAEADRAQAQHEAVLRKKETNRIRNDALGNVTATSERTSGERVAHPAETR
eukprot:1192255-Prorocentrum_minimum.AAC.1